MTKFTIGALAVLFALAAATPASAQNDVRGTGAFVGVVGTDAKSFTVAFECTASAYVDAASTSVNRCWLSSDSRVYTVTDAGNCHLRLPGPFVAVPCVGKFEINTAALASDFLTDSTSNRGLKVCWTVEASYILIPRNPPPRSGCSTASLIPAGAGADTARLTTIGVG